MKNTRATGLMPPRSCRVSNTANSVLQNRINISIVYNYLRDHGESYRAQIARELGLSAPAVARAVEKLQNDAYVIESERVPVENGRKAAKVSVNCERGYIVGVDVLADPVKVAVSDFGGNIKGHFYAPPFEAGGDLADYVIASIRDALGRVEVKSGKLSGGALLGIGVAVPAVVDPQTGAILSANLYKRVLRSNLYDRLVAAFKVPVFLENSSNLAAIGEWKHGVGRGLHSLVCIEVGNGIGAGVILDGSLYRGSSGAAGEMGYFLSSPEGLGYDSSRLGYLESHASLSAIFRSPQDQDGRHLYPSVDALLAAAISGDGVAADAIHGAVMHLSVAIINIMLLLNPELVVLGGAACELPKAEELILRPLIEQVRANYPFSPAHINLASLGGNASIIGAVQLALDSLVNHAYPYTL